MREGAMVKSEVDVIVVGGGPGGYVAAIKLAMNGKKTVLVEKDSLGGTCLNRGCIPTKALLHCTEVLDLIKSGAQVGICPGAYSVDIEKVGAYKNSVVDKLVGGVSFLLEKKGVTVIKGNARFIGNKKIAVVKENGGEDIISAANIIIATGSKNATLPIDGIDGKNVISSTEALDFSELPQSIAIIGGGVIGIEIGSIYAKFGVKTTILEAMPKILPTLDSEVTAYLESLLGDLLRIETNAKVKAIGDSKDGKVVSFELAGNTEELLAEKVLVCVGRRPNIDSGEINKAGIKTERGFAVVDSQYESTVKGVYAIGDANGKTLLAHAASAQGIFVAEKICGLNPGINTKLIPSCVYTKPEIACVGKTEDELKKENISYNVSKFPFSANGKALSMNEPEGFVKLLTGKKYGEILGAHIIGSRATDLIAELTLAINAECTIEDIANTVHAHPTVSEAIFEAAEIACFGQSIHS